MAEGLDQATIDAIGEILRASEILPRPPLPMSLLLLNVELEILIEVSRAVDAMRQAPLED